jgi:SDR family mycofactocin-dependent oxidoreductase
MSMGALEGKVAFVTGVARGQGRSHALHLSREGADVIGCDVPVDAGPVPYPLARREDLDETQRQIEALGGRCLLREADVRDADAMTRLVADGVAEFGRLDIVVANAGIWAAAQLATMTDAQWQTVIDTNLTGVFNTVRSAVQPMIEQGEGGRIIAIGSTAARKGQENLGSYAASKWGVIGLIKTFALELAVHQITANAICPAAVRTPIMQNDAIYRLFRPELEHPTQADIEPVLMTIHKLPVAWLEPEDISRVVVFLAGEGGRPITGAVYDVTLGMSANWSA